MSIADEESQSQEDNEEAENQPFVDDTSEVQALRSRYGDAYTVANTTIGIGSFLKAAGALAGIVIILASFWMGREIGDVMIIVGVIIAVGVGLLFYVLGIIVSSNGQELRASVDGTVNSSPFLTRRQKAEIMGIAGKPKQAAEEKTPFFDDSEATPEIEFYSDDEITVTSRQLIVPPHGWPIAAIKPPEVVSFEGVIFGNYAFEVFSKSGDEIFYKESKDRDQLNTISEAINEAINERAKNG